MSEVVGENVQGDKVVIEQFTDAFLKLIGKYAVDMKMTRLDLFLGAHNLHKLIVADIAHVWSQDSIDPKKTYDLADKTFHQAMRELAYPGQGQLSRKQRRATLARSIQ